MSNIGYEKINLSLAASNLKIILLIWKGQILRPSWCNDDWNIGSVMRVNDKKLRRNVIFNYFNIYCDDNNVI